MIQDRAHSPAFQRFAEDLIAKDCAFTFQAHGRSMLPIIEDGDLLRVEPVDPARLKLGDIVLFRAEGRLKAHRIVRRKGARFFTRGDATVEGDGAIERQQILGRVVAKQSEPASPLVAFTGVRARCSFLLRELRRLMRPQRRY